MDKKTLIILSAIILIAAVLRFWNFTGPDLIRDDAHYSFRAIGYFDWIASLDTQTTPVVWFPEAVWWQYLSFHDAPPLTFAVQWLFFQIFGDNLFAARLPFVLIGLLSVLAIYFLGRLIGGKTVGLISAGALAVFNYHIWISRIGLLDGFVVLWIILALYFFIKAREAPQNYLWWGAVMAFGFLTKYIFLFVIPLFGLALLFSQRSAWRERRFYLGLVIFLILFSPVIIYNLMMILERGHPDAALSTMIGLLPEDFKGLTRAVSTDLDFAGLLLSISANFSFGSLVLIIFSLIMAFFFAFKNKPGRYFDFLLLGGLFFSLVMLAFAGGSLRYAVVVLPFIAVIFAKGIHWLWQKTGKWSKAAFITVIIFAILWELFFAINSQILPEPVVNKPLFLAANRLPWLGYNRLEDYAAKFYRDHPDYSYVLLAKTRQILEYRREVIEKHLEEKGKNPPEQEHLLVYDNRMDWAAGVWIFERRSLYRADLIPTLSNFREAVQDKEFLDKFKEFGFKYATIIVAAENIPHNEAVPDKTELDKFAKKLEAVYQVEDEIRNFKGQTIFKIFKVSLADDFSKLAQ